jgi:hypothetical protein
MPVSADLEKITEAWSGGDPKLTAGLERLRKAINALIDKAGPLGGSGDSDSGTPQNVYVVAADADTGFIRIFHAQDGNLAIGTEITSDEDL